LIAMGVQASWPFAKEFPGPWVARPVLRGCSAYRRNVSRQPRGRADMKNLMFAVLLMAIIVPGVDVATAKGKKTHSPFEAVKMIIEFNSTDQDVGIQLSLDAEAWKNVSVLDPNGHKIFDVDAKGA